MSAAKRMSRSDSTGKGISIALSSAVSSAALKLLALDLALKASAYTNSTPGLFPSEICSCPLLS